MEHEGASNDERLLAAAKNDDGDMLEEIFEDPESFDINHQDGLGNTALHYAVLNESINVLPHILSHDKCDVDPINRLEGSTPLHLAVKLEDPEARLHFVEELLEAGADDTIKDKYGQTALDLVKPNDDLVISMFERFRKAATTDKGNIAYENDDDVADESD